MALQVGSGAGVATGIKTYDGQVEEADLLLLYRVVVVIFHHVKEKKYLSFLEWEVIWLLKCCLKRSILLVNATLSPHKIILFFN